MSQENKDLIRRYVDTFNKDYALALAEYVADEGMRRHVAMMQGPFPGYQLIVEDMIAEGDKVVIRATMHGTHQGDLMGIPPTGKQVTVSMIVIYRIVGAKIAEYWVVADQLGLMQQLGAIPG
ncbi:MAG: ester cyclase [Anaerolineae bacterium]|nr:ester cyclase [Anaerolineae bacterium]